jgi:putative folate metabolism gamma-glutamate ligase
MQIEAFRTHVITLGEDILDIIDTYLSHVKERDIIVITSKILSVCENCFIEKDAISKKELIKQEADAVLESDYPNRYGVHLTIKNGFLIPSAGIDESNCQNGYLVYPKAIQMSVVRIWEHIRKKYNLKEVGVLLTDSRTTPLRRGITGQGIGWCGFKPLYNYVGSPDLFGKPLRVSMSNILDALAASAVLVMGEGKEQTPLAVIKNAPKIVFLERAPTKEEEDSVIIAMEEDIYAPLLTKAIWQKADKL